MNCKRFRIRTGLELPKYLEADWINYLYGVFITGRDIEFGTVRRQANTTRAFASIDRCFGGTTASRSFR